MGLTVAHTRSSSDRLLLLSVTSIKKKLFTPTFMVSVIRCLRHECGRADGTLILQDNVLIDGRKGRENDIVLADFGLSVYTEAVSKAFDSTRRGKGNILAPELSLGRGLDPTQQNAAPAPPGPPGTIPPVPAQLGPDVSPTGRATPASDLFAFAMLCIQVSTAISLGEPR